MTASADTSARLDTPSLALLMSGIAAVGLQALMLSPLLTDVGHSLGVGPKELGLASGAYGAGVATMALLSAPRLGRWPKRTAIQLAFGAMAVGLTLCALSWDWRILALGQLVSGAAAGVIIPGTYALTADITPQHLRSQAIGRVLFGWSVALVGGVPLAAALGDLMDWRTTFAIVAAVSAAMVGLIGLLPRTARSATEQVRYGDALSIPGVPVALLATFAYMIGFYQTYTFIGDHVRVVHGTGAWLGGLIAGSYGVGFGAAMVLDAWIDRTGSRRLMPFTLALVGLNYLVLPFAMLNVWTVVFYPFLWGLANHLCMNVLVSFMGSSPAEKRSTVMGLFSGVTYIAHGLGGAVYGGVYAAYGFSAVSFAATATLFVASVAVALFLPSSPCKGENKGAGALRESALKPCPRREPSS
jgi:predicted MFS family arabinose efflux permease